jgi:hypothetical protein
MRRITAVIGVAVISVAMMAVTTTPALSLGKVKCGGVARIAVIDPIVHHNEPVGTGHEHQVFGNTAWVDLANPNTASYNDLVGDSTSCNVGIDTAGYWIPTLHNINTGQLIPTKQFTAYYRPYTGVGGPDFGPAAAFPADTRLVGTVYDWSCGQNSGARSVPVQSIPDCTGLSGKPGQTLTAHIDIPSCWDGVPPSHADADVGNTSDNSHYAYTVKKVCPVAFPNQMVAIRETIQFAYTGAGNDLALSSDAGAGTSDGQSLHADFWNTWQQPDFVQWVVDCVNVGGAYTSAKCQP